MISFGFCSLFRHEGQLIRMKDALWCTIVLSDWFEGGRRDLKSSHRNISSFFVCFAKFVAKRTLSSSFLRNERHNHVQELLMDSDNSFTLSPNWVEFNAKSQLASKKYKKKEETEPKTLNMENVDLGKYFESSSPNVTKLAPLIDSDLEDSRTPATWRINFSLFYT